jgi:predicted Zn-dependent protease
VDIPEVLRWKGRALLGLDRLEQAQQILQEARVRAESTGSNLHLWPVLADLARVNAKLGDADQAEADRREARRVAGQLADSLDEIGLRETFLGQARIRDLMD